MNWKMNPIFASLNHSPYIATCVAVAIAGKVLLDEEVLFAFF